MVMNYTRLANKKNFVMPFSKWNRHWFVNKIINYLIAKGTPASEIENRATSIIKAGFQLVRARKDFDLLGPGINFSKLIKRKNLNRRIEILYSTIGTNVEFSDPYYIGMDNYIDYLEFIVRRRYRSVMRMDYHVNFSKPRNSRNRRNHRYVRYPEKCSLQSEYQVRIDAKTYWNDSEPLRIQLKPDPLSVYSTVNPKLAILSLFDKPDINPCEGNLLDCSRVMSIVLMDSLLESKEPDKLLRYLVESKFASGDYDYLSIIDVDDHRGFVGFDDSDDTCLYSVKDRKINNLVVGDYVYITNHPLYRVFRPRGVWRGEFSLVYSRGNSNIRSKTGYVLGGHGMEGTVYKFYTRFLRELRTHLHRTHVIVKLHLDYKYKKNIQYQQISNQKLAKAC